jgi:hypothetical protein
VGKLLLDQIDDCSEADVVVEDVILVVFLNCIGALLRFWRIWLILQYSG